MSSRLSEAETNFLAFDWSDKRWQEHLENLYPMPPATSILKFKKKWYHNTIDSTFDVNSTVGETGTRSSASATASTTPDRTDAPTAATGTAAPTVSRTTRLWTTIASFLLLLAIVLHVCSIFPGKYSPRCRRASLLCYTLGFAGSIIASNGLPRLNAEWWQLLMYHDGTQSCLVTMVAFPVNFWIAMVSPFLSAVLYLTESLPTISPIQPIIRQPRINQLLTQLKDNRYVICGIRADVEIYAGLLVLILAFAGRLPFISTLMYWNTLRVKYAVNNHTKLAFAKMNSQITGVLNHPSAPKAFLSVYTKIAGVLSKYGGQQA